MLNNIYFHEIMTDRELLEENNKMLKEILSFVRKVDSVEYRDGGSYEFY